MRRVVAAFKVAVVSVVIASPLAAQSSMTLEVAGGLSAATGSLGDAVDLGYNVGAGLQFGGTRVPVGLRFEGGFNSFAFRNGVDANVRVITGTANAVFNITQTSDAPYVIAGLGAYNRRTSANAFSATDSRTATGINLGGGLRFPVMNLSTFIEARYHRMLGQANQGANYQFIPITFGIVF